MRKGIYGLLFAVLLHSCSLFTGSDPAAVSPSVESVHFDKTSLSLQNGAVSFLNLAITPSTVQKGKKVTYTYDQMIIAVDGDSYGAVVSAVRAGSTVLRATVDGVSASCVVTVTGTNPIESFNVISSNNPVVELEAGTVKQLLVSLTGGTSQNMTQFSWSIDKNAVASIESSGQNCIVTGKENGTARITVSHPDARYPLELLVFVKPDAEKPVYVTTSQNIISLASGSAEKQVSVSLVNGSAGSEYAFTWEVLSSEDSNAGILSLTSNHENALLSPLSAGSATVRVTHPDALYPLDIKVRVVDIVENVYIEPSSIRVTLSGEGVQTVTARLSGSSRAAYFDPGEFTWTLDTEEYCAMTVYQEGIVLSGKKNGMAKVTVHHPSAAFPRELLVFVENQTSGAVSTAMYITTSQNYIQTKTGAADVELSVELVGGSAGDERDFLWSVTDPSIVSMRTVHGQISAARSVNLFQRTAGTSYITALKEGLTTISISHPKIIGSTEVLVKVHPETAILEAHLYIQGPAILGIIRGQSKNVTLTLSGNYTPSDDALLSWAGDNTGIVSVMGNGKEASVTANGNGQAYISISHPKADGAKKILCYVAETEEELAAFKLLYTEKTAYHLLPDSHETLRLLSANIEPAEIAAVSWQSDNPGVVSVIPGTTNMEGIVTAHSLGTVTVTASLPGLPPVVFAVTVHESLSPLLEAVYFTTSQNVVQFSSLNTTKTVSVTPVRLDPAFYSNITWQVDNPSVASVTPNGASASLTSLANGTAKITVSHPDAVNNLVITVRVGAEYIIVNPLDPFISASQDVVTLTENSQGFQLSAVLHNSTKTGGFSWFLSDPSVASLSPLESSCFIIPKSPGQTLLSISHDDAVYPKTVIVLVENTERNLAVIPYLTTSQNQVLLTTGTQQTVSVRIRNNETAVSDFSWDSDNPQSLQVIESGPQALFRAVSSGIARVTVTHPSCEHPLQITVIITDNLADASAHPYITSAQNIVTVTKGEGTKTVSVTLAGGTEPDNQNFLWQVDNTQVASLTANGQNGVVKGLSAGECRITVSHPKAAYSFTIVVICDEGAPSSNLYISPSHPIITLKPADAEQTVSASLIGGTAEDKYGFTWYADNYNAVDLTYQANTAVISPKQEGTATITITHPKAAYDGQITVRVTEYSAFAFSQTSMTIMEGTTQFISMQVPAMDSAYSGRITYTTDNPKIVTVTGTNKVAQVTATGAGTAIVSAVSPSGTKSEMMVYVQKAAEAVKPYITSASSVLSMKAGDGQKSVSASLTGEGVVQTDQYNLKWTVDNPGVASLTGSTGTNVLVKAVGAGETTIRISHEKTDTVFTLYVQVEGVTKGVNLNKNYMSLETGKTGELTVTITGGTSEDYKQITWSAGKVNNADVVSILGSGKTVAVYGVSPGQTTVRAEFNGNTDTCDVLVQAARQFSFDTQTMRIQPGQTKTFSYTLIPDEAAINWITSSNDYISYSVNTSAKTVTVTGISDGSSASGTATKLTGTANSMSANITITCAWDYRFSLGKSLITGDPRTDPANPDKFVIPYEVNPASAKIEVQISKDVASWVVDTANRKITLTPKGEGEATLLVTAVNGANNTKFSTQNCMLNFNYSNLTLQPSAVSVNGRFSRYNGDSGTIVLGDGEEITVKLVVTETNAQYTLSGVRFDKASGSEAAITLAASGSDMWKLTGPADTVTSEFTVYHDITLFDTDGSGITVSSWDMNSGLQNYAYDSGKEGSVTATHNWSYRGQTGSDSYGDIPVSSNYSRDYRIFFIATPEGVKRVQVYYSYTFQTSGNAGSTSFKSTKGALDYSSAVTGSLVTVTKTPKSSPLAVSETEFKANPLWYAPVGGTGLYINDTARYETSTSTAVQSSKIEGYLAGTIAHNGVNQAFQIPVLLEVRNCSAK
jgi:hypothetical protein